MVGLLPCYSYCNSVVPYYGSTGNAAANGLQWSMSDVFPAPPGLSVQNVIYSYTVRKAENDALDVYVQNKNALGEGYIFREKDSWLPGSQDGTQINKAVPVLNIPKEAWGDGSIELDGKGSVEDPNVVYTYQVDPCYDPQYSPNCPGYQTPIPDIEEVSYDVYDASEDVNNVQYNPDDRIYEEEEKESDKEKAEREAEEELDGRSRLEKALSAAETNIMFASAFAQANAMQSVSNAVKVNSYYQTTIPGGVYKENTSLSDKKIPDNRNGLRNGLAQQILHDKMVEMQYGN